MTRQIFGAGPIQFGSLFGCLYCSDYWDESFWTEPVCFTRQVCKCSIKRRQEKFMVYHKGELNQFNGFLASDFTSLLHWHWHCLNASEHLHRFLMGYNNWCQNSNNIYRYVSSKDHESLWTLNAHKKHGVLLECSQAKKCSYNSYTIGKLHDCITHLQDTPIYSIT